jgi:hypothetical protein
MNNPEFSVIILYWMRLQTSKEMDMETDVEGDMTDVDTDNINLKISDGALITGYYTLQKKVSSDKMCWIHSTK